MGASAWLARPSVGTDECASCSIPPACWKIWRSLPPWLVGQPHELFILGASCPDPDRPPRSRPGALTRLGLSSSGNLSPGQQASPITGPLGPPNERTQRTGPA